MTLLKIVCVCVPNIVAMATIQGQHLFPSEFLIVVLFEYSRVASIWRNTVICLACRVIEQLKKTGNGKQDGNGKAAQTEMIKDSRVSSQIEPGISLALA